ncbi:syndetin-like [Gigantopelta aegis]|uniref:syndetin-like n=1 Tax=Gigantopelta aegis TaxID=1735272 RepID=UPI001B88A93F|nr:syndetin-like [Gigantopelta aegis]
MDLKLKFKSLIGKQDSVQSPTTDFSSEQFKKEPAVAKFKFYQPSNPLEDQETIDGIEEEYYKDETFDTSHFELEKLNDICERDQINTDRIRLRKQLEAVSKKISELILQNHPAYAAELQEVMDLQKKLQLAGVICRKGRKQLSWARESFTTASLGLLANYRKRQQLVGLLKSLRTIKTLQRTDLRLREMMEEEDYCGAIQLCLECQKAASTFRHYKCISELSSKLQDTLEMIEEQLDVALSKTCVSFDVPHYEKVQTAYRLLGKTQTAMDQLHMHFASAIHNTANTIVLGYVELYSGTSRTNFQKRQYADLCKHITIESFTPCLIDLCKALWGVMKSYYQTMQWHETHDQDIVSEAGEPGSQVEFTFNRRYVMKKLEYGRLRIWQDVQQKVKTFVLGTDISGFKLEEFISVLDLINRMIEIGEEFCRSKSEGLQDSLKQQSLNYFRNHHRARLDELRMFLENEGWELCPVKSNFSILQLLEFRFMRNWQNKIPAIQSPESDGLILSIDVPNNPNNSGYFTRFLINGNPFDTQQDEEEKEDVFSGAGDNDHDGYGDSDSDSDVPDELKQDYIDELTGETRSHRYTRQRSKGKGQKHAPFITNTTLNVLRVVGKYLQMMTVLKPVAFDVINYMSQLFDYILYTVHAFFGTDTSVSSDKSVNNRLSATLQRIRDNMIASSPESGSMVTEMTEHRDRVPPATMSPIVDLHSPNRLFGLAERVVATESLVYLAEQLEFLQPFLESMIPPTKKAFLQQFYSQTVNMAVELRKPIYKAVAAQAIDYSFILHQMSNVRWDVKEIMSQHNPYIDTLLNYMVDFKNKLAEVDKHVPLPKAVLSLLWEHCVRLANKTFVDGYSNARKCSNEGRALMQLDFQQFITRLDRMIDLKPIPDRDFVEMYIKAYYLPESQLESWIQDHKEYSSKQLLALIGSVDHINKKARQRLINIIEDIDKIRR